MRTNLAERLGYEPEEETREPRCRRSSTVSRSTRGMLCRISRSFPP